MSAAGYPIGAMYDPRAPFNQPQLDAADAHKIDTRQDELAIDSFDNLDTYALDWLDDNRDRDEALALMCAGIAYERLPRDPDASQAHAKAVQALRDLYVQECREVYRQRAEEEVTS